MKRHTPDKPLSLGPPPWTPEDMLVEPSAEPTACPIIPPDLGLPATRLAGGVFPAPRFRDYLELTKPKLSSLSVLTALAGYGAAHPSGGPDRLIQLACATALAAGGAAALNMGWELESDARMKRTAERPLPAGRISRQQAFGLGCLLAVSGVVDLYYNVNALSSLLAAITVGSYILLYTPAKGYSRWSTEIGAVCGALPPLIGWSAAHGTISTLGWLLFAILYLWQIPHFMAIAWNYRKDYANASFPMLSVLDDSGRRVAAWAFVHTLILVAVSLLPTLLGYCTIGYGIIAATMGAGFIWHAAAFLRPPLRDQAARKLFLYSIIYLPAILTALVVDRLIFQIPG